MDRIFIIHALNNYEAHEKRLRSILPGLDIPFEFVTDGDQSFFTPELINQYFCKDISNVLSPGVLSCTLNHIKAYEKLVELDLDYAIIFENDPFFIGDFKAKLSKIQDEIKRLKPGFIISLENTTLRFPKRRSIVKDQFLYPATRGRAAGAYIIDRKAAEKMLKDLQTKLCCQVIDWWHNDMIDRNVVRMYWAHPVLTEQGSHNGKMHAVISSKKSSYSRQLRWIAQKTYKKIRWYIRG